MAEDPSVVVIGEDVGRCGGAYRRDQGPGRGVRPRARPRHADLRGGDRRRRRRRGGDRLRPVAEIMYVDFIGMTMDPIVNQAAKMRYMFGGQIGVPLVHPHAGRRRPLGNAAQHSQSLEAYVMHTPGLRLAMPATVADAYHLLRAVAEAPGPGRLHRAQGALHDEGDGRPRRRAAALGQGRRPPRGCRPRHRHLLAPASLRHGGGEAARRAGHRGDGDRPPHPQSRSTSTPSASGSTPSAGRWW